MVVKEKETGGNFFLFRNVPPPFDDVAASGFGQKNLGLACGPKVPFGFSFDSAPVVFLFLPSSI